MIRKKAFGKRISPGSELFRKQLHGAGIILILLVWTTAAAISQYSAGKPFPFPWDAAAAIVNWGENGPSIAVHTAASLVRWSIGYSIAVSLGLAVGIAMAYVPTFGELASPAVAAVQLIPGLAWVPIALILFGLGNSATVFMIAATAIAPVIINTRAGIQQISPSLLRAARMMELSSGQVFFRVIIPGAAPSMVSGFRAASANGFRVLISAEMVVGSSLGLGYNLLQARWNLDYAAAFGALILIVIIGLIIEKSVFYPLEQRIHRRWGFPITNAYNKNDS